MRVGGGSAAGGGAGNDPSMAGGSAPETGGEGSGVEERPIGARNNRLIGAGGGSTRGVEVQNLVLSNLTWRDT